MKVNKEFVDIDGIKTAYIKRDGGKKIVVILHGWGAYIESIMPIFNSVPDDYTVYAYDAPGFGDSDDPSFVMGTYDYYEFLLKFLEKFSIKKATFIGHSFGGKTLTILGARNKEIVDKLVMIDASGVLPKRKLSYYGKVYSFKAAKKLYMITHGNSEESLEKFYKKHGSDDYQSANGIMRKCFVKVVNESTREEFKNIDAETLLIWGDKDEATPFYMAEIFEKEIKNSGLVILKDAGHYSYIDKFSQFNAVLNSFLD